MKFTTKKAAREFAGISYLGSVNSSAKIMKNDVIHKVSTYGLYLAPHKVSGYNTCSHSTPECRLGCLNESGRIKIQLRHFGNSSHNNARIKKSRLLFEHTDFFMGWLVAEIQTAKTTAEKKKRGFAVRLNCTSDIDWANIYYNGKNIFEIFSDVQFYDYTKNPKKYINKPKNHHLTFSYTGRNWNVCEMVLAGGENVAVVFNIKKNIPLPSKFRGFDVIDGDISDYRVKDLSGVIIGLYWKEIGSSKEINDKARSSVFAVQPSEIIKQYESEKVSV